MRCDQAHMRCDPTRAPTLTAEAAEVVAAEAAEAETAAAEAVAVAVAAAALRRQWRRWRWTHDPRDATHTPITGRTDSTH
jgi:hypothetical protein